MPATHSCPGPEAMNARETRSGRVSGPVPGSVVRGPFARVIPSNPAAFISRWTVHRATGWPWRRSSVWTLRTPQTLKLPSLIVEYIDQESRADLHDAEGRRRAGCPEHLLR